MDIRKITVVFAITASFVLGSLAGIPAAFAHNKNNYHGNNNRHAGFKDNPDILTQQLYRDGSVSCNGADNTSHNGGRVSLFPGNGEVHFKITLKKASPDSTYTVAISEEPNCANAQFYTNAITTDGSGNAVLYGTYDNNGAGVPEGEHNLLVNMVTTTPDKAKNREIATKNARVEVPGGL